jgi:hypothetical protein
MADIFRTTSPHFWRQRTIEGNMANGWTPERRALQAAMIHTWKCWEQSTGPRTAAGKAKSAQNVSVGQQRKANELVEAKRELFAAIARVRALSV